MAQEAQKQLESEGLVVEFIHPYDDPAIIAGQGTMGREMMMQAPYLQERGGCSHAAQLNGSSSAGDSEQLGGSSAWRKRPAASPPLDIVIAPVGGGGMLSGVATAVKGIDPRTFVVGAEPKGE
jgi:threonine dehydratase